MLKLLPILSAIPLLLAFGAVEGVWSERWHKSGALEQAAARLDQLPLNVGDWQGRDQELDARVQTLAELSGYRSRQYVHRTTGATLSVLLVCGRPGPVAVHSPEVCYAGAGYALTAPKER